MEGIGNAQVADGWSVYTRSETLIVILYARCSRVVLRRYFAEVYIPFIFTFEV